MYGMPSIEKASTIIKRRIEQHHSGAESAIADAINLETMAKTRRQHAETHIKAAKELGDMLKTVEAAERVGGFVDSVLDRHEAERAEMQKAALHSGLGAIEVKAEGDAITMRHVDIRAGMNEHWDKPISADLMSMKDRD